ncbi:MAG: methylenetetrahydrofolate reductase [Thermonema sp.]|uniref:methylenetetrahydrofolate reductase [NAD(P)H] n=1 Tax=Thermonema sp. TaxID=2231181 RepID=UPI0021DDF44A|nr:methylenetetrahydrofolate reductase [NAD(P)H] [Thermonema sp.]GIV38836.1 MAG: methylenetetrahydrofolate reductase [Thermonema sp.]
MKIVEYLRNTDKTLFSFEVLPPMKGQSIQGLFNTLDQLMEFRPKFVNVTYHREEFVYKKRPDGLLERKTIRKRPGTVGICAAILHRYGVEPVPHLICGGFTKEETENALIDLHYLGIHNILVLRGDPIPTEKVFTPEPGGHRYAVELLEQVVNMNHGIYLEEEIENAVPTDFCIGVAGYPEKHYEAPNLQCDLRYLKMKVDKGADYIVTQMFFDNRKYFEFVEKCRAMGIHVPIVPGLKPLTSKRQLTMIPRVFHVELPEELVKEVEKCETDAQVKEVGVEWCIAQSKELMQHKVPCLHYYSMSKADSVRKVAEALF